MYKYLTNLCVVVGLSCALSFSVMAQDAVRKELLTPLAAAQEAMKNNQNEQALALLREALSLPALSGPEQNLILRMQAVAALRAQKMSVAIDALERLVTSAEISASEKYPLLEALINAAFQFKDTERVVKWAHQYHQSGGKNPSVSQALVQSLFAAGQHTQVVTVMLVKIKADMSSGQKTPEAELRTLALSYRQLKDDIGYLNTLKQLLLNYPSKAYWAEVLGRIAQQPGFNARFELDLYRLLEQTNNMESASDHAEMASLSLKAGLPSEAVRVIHKGFDAGVLGQGQEAAAHGKLRAEAQKKVEQDDAVFVQLEQAAQDGASWAAVGDVYFSKSNWAAAHAAYTKALGAGGLRREPEVRLHDAISLLMANQKEAARQQFATVQGDTTAAELASLWVLFAR
jgi:tetratricopeptide (TPR) repeat protein